MIVHVLSKSDNVRSKRNVHSILVYVGGDNDVIMLIFVYENIT